MKIGSQGRTDERRNSRKARYDEEDGFLMLKKKKLEEALDKNDPTRWIVWSSRLKWKISSLMSMKIFAKGTAVG